MTTEAYVTEEVKSHIGNEGQERVSEPIENSEVRRFTQAIMDRDPIYWDEESTKKTRYSGIVCPPLFPTSVYRTPGDAPDPIEQGFNRDPDFDGLGRGGGGGPQMPPLPLKRTLNAGNEIEFFQYAKPGERIISKSRIHDIYEREGRSGRMVFIVTETTVKNDKGELLFISRATSIRR